MMGFFFAMSEVGEGMEQDMEEIKKFFFWNQDQARDQNQEDKDKVAPNPP